MISYGLDYVAQIGTMALGLAVTYVFVHVYFRVLRPLIERVGLAERVKMALYDVELEKFCKENGVDYSKIDIQLEACYKKKNGKLKTRLNEIEQSM